MTEIDPDQQALGSRLVAARKTAKLTQSAVAVWLTAHGYECGKQAIGAWESGRNMPNPLVLRRLCRLYACAADSLLWDSADEIPQASPTIPPEISRRLAALDATQRAAVLRSLAATLDAIAPAPAGPPVATPGKRAA